MFAFEITFVADIFHTVSIQVPFWNTVSYPASQTAFTFLTVIGATVLNVVNGSWSKSTNT